MANIEGTAAGYRRMTDPAYSYGKTFKTNKDSNYSNAKTNDLVLEDSEESESIAGSGKPPRISSNLHRTVNSSLLGREVVMSRAKPLGFAGPHVSDLSKLLKTREACNRPRLEIRGHGSRLNHGQRDRVNTVAGNRSSTSGHVVMNSQRLIDVLQDSPTGQPYISPDLAQIFAAEARIYTKDVVNIRNNETSQRIAHFSESQSRTIDEERLHSTDTVRHVTNPECTSKTVEKDDLVLCDIEDNETDKGNFIATPLQWPRYHREKSQHWSSSTIDLPTAVELKTVLLGSVHQSFSSEWLNQSFDFSEHSNLRYGLVQKKGGPCGVLSAVQSYILYELLFGPQSVPRSQWNVMSQQEYRLVLARALANMLWTIGRQERAIVSLCGRHEHIRDCGKFRKDGITERLLLYTFSVKDDLLAFFSHNISQFSGNILGGVILCLYSAILSRTVKGVRGDMDDPDGHLMAEHNYCSQEMVNLLVTGRAVSNVANGTTELLSDGHITRLHGITNRSDIGFLSLFEHYQTCEVGTFYKTPRFPIWIVCSESHFSVLFSCSKDLVNDWKAERRFDLYYYDGLAKQEVEIKLSIDTTIKGYKAPDDDEICPPLELCIRTKWKDAYIDWNGTDPIL